MITQEKWWRTPEGVLWMSLASYVVRVALKMGLGIFLSLPAVWGDGVHNTSDIITCLVILWVVRHAIIIDDDHPVGRGGLESLVSFLQGGALLAVGATVAYESVVGITTRASVLPEASTQAYIATALLYMGSVLTSFILGRYQVAIGRRYSRPAVVSDGKESISDGFVELGVLAGVVSMIIVGNALGGHFAGILVSLVVTKTGLELVKEGYDALCQKSVGASYVHDITGLIEGTPGVIAVSECRAYRIGGRIRVEVKVILDQHVRVVAARDQKWAIASRIVDYLARHEMPDVEILFRHDPGEPRDVRVAYLIERDAMRRGYVTDLQHATHIRWCDYQYGKVVRIDEAMMPRNLEQFLGKKHIHTLIGWAPQMDSRLLGSCKYEMAVFPLAPETIDL